MSFSKIQILERSLLLVSNRYLANKNAAFYVENDAVLVLKGCNMTGRVFLFCVALSFCFLKTVCDSTLHFRRCTCTPSQWYACLEDFGKFNYNNFVRSLVASRHTNALFVRWLTTSDDWFSMPWYGEGC